MSFEAFRDRLAKISFKSQSLTQALRQIQQLNSKIQELEQGAKYLDLNDPQRHEFTAMGGMETDSNNWCVPKTEVSYQLWNRLIGVQNPERLDQASES